ncbi:MAG: adenosylcobinamide amidohydrolase [Thermoprotei archaeon]
MSPGPLWSRDGVKAYFHYGNHQGFAAKTLLVSFPQQRRALSTYEGLKDVLFACIHYAPKEFWAGIRSVREAESYVASYLSSLDVPREKTACLMTAADVEKASVKVEEYKSLWFAAFATAGTKHNAMRAGVDEAQCWEDDMEFYCGVGTISIILTTNATLTEAAMARAIITATEAKVAALEDFGVESSYTKGVKATGTGTDNVVVVSGIERPVITYTGGHAKAGELIARAVYKAVLDALRKEREG